MLVIQRGWGISICGGFRNLACSGVAGMSA